MTSPQRRRRMGGGSIDGRSIEPGRSRSASGRRWKSPKAAFLTAWPYADVRRASAAKAFGFLRASAAPEQTRLEARDPALQAQIARWLPFLLAGEGAPDAVKSSAIGWSMTGVAAMVGSIWVGIPYAADRIAARPDLDGAPSRRGRRPSGARCFRDQAMRGAGGRRGFGETIGAAPGRLGFALARDDRRSGVENAQRLRPAGRQGLSVVGPSRQSRESGRNTRRAGA